MFNIPSRFKDDDLRRLFEPFGRVLSCKVEAMTMGEIPVMMDKVKNVSKCSGFVNFA